MTGNQINNYVDAQVKALSDRTIAPLVEAINQELASQTRNNDQLAAFQAKVTKDNDESNKRITELQANLGKAHQAANALAAKLAEATAGAVATGQE